jgi:glucose-1-phosphate adenylyltransferase
MGIYVFRRQFLIDLLRGGSEQDFGRHLMGKVVNKGRAFGYNFQGYWADVGTVQAFYEANLALLAETPALDLYDPEWVIHTASADRPGVELGATARVENSLLSDGCQIFGSVSNSVLSPGVYVSPGAMVRDSIVMGDAWIGENAVLDRAIVDEGARIEAGCVVGDGESTTPNQEAPERLNTGLTIIGLQARIPAGVTIGRNVAIRPRTPESAFGGKHVPSGGTV